MDVLTDVLAHEGWRVEPSARSLCGAWTLHEHDDLGAAIGDARPD